MKILIELPSWLGDTIMTTPAIENIVGHFIDPEITLIGPLISLEVFKYHPKIVKTFEINKKYRFFNKFSRQLGKFDEFFSFRGSSRSIILKFFINSVKKYQYDKFKYQGLHQVEKYNNFVNDCLGNNTFARKLKVYKDSNIDCQSQKAVLGINPGASYGQSKRWRPEEFAKVIIALSNKYEIIIFGGPGEIDIASDIEKSIVAHGVKNYQNLVGKTSVEELINLISNLNLFITGDSGPMHIAASFQVPTISIFGPTNPDETSQWMVNKSVIIKNNLSCQPCMKRKCPLVHNNCMNHIKSERVLKAVKIFN